MDTLYIGGLGFSKISDWSYCPRYPIKLEPSHIKENDLVFLNLDEFDNFLNIVLSNPPKAKFILITHNSDKSFTHTHYDKIKQFTNKVYAINSLCKHESVITIPIGFRDMPIYTIPILKGIQRADKKDILAYMNFSIKTNYNTRSECYDSLSNKYWVTKRDGLSINEFYTDITKSKYVISPEGTGIDCHRIYESIYFNAIPILKTSGLDKFYKKLPVLIVDSWEDITEELLQTTYQALYNRLLRWKEKNIDWLSPKFWIQ
jgi:hypothetical protein